MLFRSIIDLSRLRDEPVEGAEKKLGELVDALAFPHIHSDQGLDLALERMGENQLDIPASGESGECSQAGRHRHLARRLECIRREPCLIRFA